MDLLSIPDAPTNSIKDELKALYLLNRTAFIELGVVLPLFMLVVKDGQKGWCRTQREHGGIPRVDNINVLVDLMVGGSGRIRENTTVALLNLVKSNRDKAVEEVREVNKARATVKALADDNNEVSARGKNEAKTLLRILESGWERH